MWKTNEPEKTLRLEIQPDGNAAGIYEGQLLVIGFKWRDSIQVFEPIPINKTWEKLLLTNHAFQYYLDRVIKEITAYRQGALKLAAEKEIREAQLSGFLIIEH